MKQGRADISGPRDQKIEPRSQGINPGGVSQMGTAIGNHSDRGTSSYSGESMNAGRGFRAPGIGTTTHKSGSQGKH